LRKKKRRKGETKKEEAAAMFMGCISAIDATWKLNIYIL
jgi:hypothetical protein